MSESAATVDAMPTRREALDQACKRWYEGDRDYRIKLAKAYLMDAVQQQADEVETFSFRVEKGIRMLTEALSKHEQCPTCRGSGKVKSTEVQP